MADADHHRGSDFKRAADQLAELAFALEAVDLNALATDDDVRALLDAKATVEDMALRHRQDQRAKEGSDGRD